MKAIMNGTLITEAGPVARHAVLYDKKILGIVPESEFDKNEAEAVMDAGGLYISPGFIDIHTHGVMGHDVMDADAKGLRAMRLQYASSGVTGFLATTMTMDRTSMEAALRILEKEMQIHCGAQILGCHLEGPFINPRYSGAQNASFVQNPDFSLIEQYKHVIQLVTVAPESKEALAFIQACVREGIAVSVGHSGASFDETIQAIRRGAKSMTHMFNAMTPLHHREPGAAGAALDEKDVYCELIADNIHVHPAMQRLLLKVKGIEKIILVTDSIRAAGLADGSYALGGQSVQVKDSCARLDNGTLAGSVLMMHQALRNFMCNTGVCFADAIRTVTVNPATLLGIQERKGSLKVGKDADFVILDGGFRILNTVVEGVLCYPGSR